MGKDLNTLSEFKDLFEHSGFRIERMIQTPESVCLIKAVPV